MDVASMLHSFDYATYAARFAQRDQGQIHEEQFPILAPWMRLWHQWAGAAFLRGYLGVVDKSNLLPRSRPVLALLLDALLLDKAVSEIGYDLVHRPAWIEAPLEGILQLMRSGKSP